MKKALSAFIAAIMIVTLAFGCVNAGAVGATTGEVDVIFLVDSSRSMKKSDPEFIRLEAIKLFADLCTLEKTKVGFVLFGDEINYSQEPTPINTEDDRVRLKETVSGLTELEGTTDIGKAVKYAVEMLSEDSSGGNSGKFIVFLSDGKTVITGQKSDRTIEDSKKDLEEGISLAQENGIPIYTIGLNANGDVDEEELRHISASTFADDTYMTDSAEYLSGILSSIYVGHTGSENTTLAKYDSNGEYHDITFGIADSTVVEANIVVMHPGGLDDLKLYGTDGAEVTFDGSTASISQNDSYSLIKLYYPKTGDRRLSVKSPADTTVTVNCILTMDYHLELSLLTDKAAGSDTKFKFSAVLKDLNGTAITDENILSRLSCKVTVSDFDNNEIKSVLLQNDNGTFRGESALDIDSSYIFQASLYSENMDIRSDFVIVEPGLERFIEPESPLKMILICTGAGVLLIAVIAFALKKHGDNVKMWSGRLTVSGNTGGMPAPPAVFDFAKKVPGKRKITLFEVLKGSFGDQRADNLIPRKISESVIITMSRSGDIRISQCKELEYSGGLAKGKNTVISTGGRATIKYADKSGGMNNTVIIQYMRT